MCETNWYKQSLYEQSWENYRNEDANYRSTMWQYLVFAAGIVIASTQAQPATRFFGVLGLIISLATACYIGRITMYSRRWLYTKDSAISKGFAKDEIAQSEKAKKELRFMSTIPGWIIGYSFPVAAGLFFLWMIIMGDDAWNSN